MAKLTNNTDSIGPYPGRTWEEEIAEKHADTIFGFMVHHQLERGKCDYHACGKPIPEEYHFCSPECQQDFEDDCAMENEWEARVS
jgi:hypothetical protein